MKANKSLLFTLLLSIPFLFGSCSDKDDETQGGAKDTEDQSINEWIYDEMSEKYFWNEFIPSSISLNFNKQPEDFFSDLIYKYNTPEGDRFSYMKKDGVPYFPSSKSENNTSHSRDLGFEFRTIHYTDINKFIYYVAYVKKDTDAAKKLKRGYNITSVNGQTINNDNFYKLLDSGASEYKLKIDGIDKEITIQTTSNYSEKPIFLSKIIPVGDKKVGYLVYNFFANDKEDNSKQYAVELNDVFKEFEANAINELVLDFRYNLGGLVESGTYLASAIVPNRTTKMKYTTRQFNKKYDALLRKELSADQYDHRVNNYFVDAIIVNRTSHNIPRLNMERVYVLTTQNTASASEQVINGLRGHNVTVEVIGETTTGKNMESFSISDNNNKDNKWILQPLSSKSFNALGFSDYTLGFDPTIGGQTIEFKFHRDENNILVLYPLGDENELLLSTAINHIQGQRRISKRSVDKQSNAIIVGSSLARKSNNMIIDIPSGEIKQE